MTNSGQKGGFFISLAFVDLPLKSVLRVSLNTRKVVLQFRGGERTFC